MAPEMFGPYRLEELIGRGGMGEVHRATDTARGRVVALKRLPAPLAGDAQFRARFSKEAALASRLAEPHIVPIHDFGEIDGRLYLDMRLVHGRDLGSVIAAEGALAPVRAAAIVAQIASALDAAHADGLVHRDVKPSNVLITDDRGRDFVYLVDFGIAQSVGAGGDTALTATGATIGTVDYMAPERFGTGGYDHRVDVYSLACLLFECLTGRKPFRGEGLIALVHAHLNLEPPRPSQVRPGIGPELDAVVGRGMAKEPARRFASAGALADAATAAATRAGTAVGYTPTLVQGPLPYPPPPPPPPPKRSRWPIVAAVVAAAAVVAGAVIAAALAIPTAGTGGTPTTTVAAATSSPAPVVDQAALDQQLFDATVADGITKTACTFLTDRGTAVAMMECDSIDPVLDYKVLFERHDSPATLTATMTDAATALSGDSRPCDAGGRAVETRGDFDLVCGFLDIDGSSYYRVLWTKRGTDVIGWILDADPAVAWKWWGTHDPF